MIGVFLCHCGNNIAGTVDIEYIKKELSNRGIINFDNIFLCSQEGQDLILERIKEENLDRIVIAACSPKHHEDIFKRCVEKEINPYLLEMVNIREQCSWVHRDKGEATKKALALITGAIRKAEYLSEIHRIEVPISKEVLIVGGGVAGIQCALELAKNDYKVYLLEKEPCIGGNMVRLNKTFPTDDCSMCTIAPKISEVGSHENIEIISMAEIEDIKGSVGNFTVKIKQKPRYVNEKCTACGECAKACVLKDRIEDDFNLGLSKRSAIYIPYEPGMPSMYVVDAENCLYVKKGKCKQTCLEACFRGAIDFEQEEKEFTLNVGAIVLATGYQEYDLTGTEYNFEHPNVITGLQLERLLSANGPTGGTLRRPSDGKIPKTVVFVQCAGSRSEKHNEYCSKICCMHALKNSMIVKSENPDTEVYYCYIDLRAAGRGYEEYYDRAREMGIKFIRGNVGDIQSASDNLIVRVEDTLLGENKEIEAELVVLSTALVPSEGTKNIKDHINVSYEPDGFVSPLHPKIEPVDTKDAGIFICGTVSGPKAIQDCVAEANAVSSRIQTILHRGKIEVDLKIPSLDKEICVRCGECIVNCAFNGVEDFEVLEGVCRSCGKCIVNCPSSALETCYYSDRQIESQIEGILEVDPDSIIAFCCNECSYAAADLAGVAKINYPSQVKIIRVPCTGRVSLNHILKSFELGAQGVMVAGCLADQCHYIDGNYNAAEIVERGKKILDLLNIGSERLKMFYISAAMRDAFVQAVKEMVETTKKLSEEFKEEKSEIAIKDTFQH